MMKNIIKCLKKYKISVYIALLIVIVGVFVIILLNYNKDNKKLKKVENDYYTLIYDKSWSLKEKKKDNILLKNGKKAKLNIKIIELTDELKYSSVEDLIDEIIYNINKQNPKYKLLTKKDTTISKYEYKGYKLLYENKESQVMTTIYKKSDKLIMINYESDNEYFDILLDSVQNVIYNFDTKEKKFNLKNKISINTKAVKYSKDDELDKKLISSKTYEIANKNYYVKYSIPNNFKMSDFDSKNNFFNLKGIDKKNIIITTNIYNYNIFEMIDKGNRNSIFDDYKYYKTNKDYSDFKESLTKIDGKIETYLYKNSYNYNKAVTYENLKEKEYKRKDENAVLIYALDKNHIFVVNIEAIGTSITKKLINNIKIEKIKNYSSYITSVKKDGMLIGNLKRYSEMDNKKIDEIIIKLPDKYTEIQQYNNIYSERIYGLNYDDDKDIYDYEINYKLTTSSTKIDSQVNIINSSFTKVYGKCNYLTKSNDIILNNLKFTVYNGGYTQLGGVMFTNNRFKYYINKKVLFYKMDNGGYLVIEISGNGKEITDEILNYAINFEIKKIDN